MAPQQTDRCGATDRMNLVCVNRRSKVVSDELQLELADFLRGVAGRHWHLSGHAAVRRKVDTADGGAGLDDCADARLVDRYFADIAIEAYVELFRNIPILVQLFLWFFVVPELLPRAVGLWLKQLPNASFWTAAIGIGLYMAARVAEQVRAGINALPRGQAMAGTALGFTTAQTYRYVLLPMAFRIILPPLSSEFLNTIKNTAVALTIGLAELTGRARSMQEFSFQVFEAFIAATVLYLLINAVVVAGMRWLERRVAVPGYLTGK
jgi:glutamate/aspartate transport system permease protein